MSDAPQDDRKEARRLFAGPCDFLLAAGKPEDFDALPHGLPEVAFWGRSNVGKSSLINAITNRKGLARASNTPGRTQQIVFFNLGGRLLFADLPGYGHAKAPKADIARWQSFIRHYLKTRAKLRCVLLLIDGRHGALAKDLEMMDFLDKLAVSYQVCATKADQLKPAERAARLEELTKILKKHPAARPTPLWASAINGEGIDDVRAFLLDIAENG